MVFGARRRRRPLAKEGAQPETAPADARKPDPFGFADFTWLTGNARTKDSPLDSKVFTGEFRVDTNYTFSFNHPEDDTISGSSEIFLIRAKCSGDPSSASAATFTTTTSAAA